MNIVDANVVGTRIQSEMRVKRWNVSHHPGKRNVRKCVIENVREDS